LPLDKPIVPLTDAARDDISGVDENADALGDRLSLPQHEGLAAPFVRPARPEGAVFAG
jgi:hypothetical protein